MQIERYGKRTGIMNLIFLVRENKKKIGRKKIPAKSYKVKVNIDFQLFLVYNSIMISQVFVTIDPQAAEPIIRRSKGR